jgi:hypothetical protein
MTSLYSILESDIGGFVITGQPFWKYKRVETQTYTQRVWRSQYYSSLTAGQKIVLKFALSFSLSRGMSIKMDTAVWTQACFARPWSSAVIHSYQWTFVTNIRKWRITLSTSYEPMDYEILDLMGVSCNVEWQFRIDRSGKPLGLIFKGQAFNNTAWTLALEPWLLKKGPTGCPATT